MPGRSKASVGIIGLGIIGTRIVARLREAGHEVWLWNRSPRAEPNFLASPREVAEAANVIQFFVSDGPALLDSIDSMALGLTPNHLLINHATIFPEEAREAERRARQVGASFLDAPFTGSRDAADRGQLVYYVGGEPEVIKQAWPVLQVCAKEILVMGRVGDASAIKIATNLLSAAIVQAQIEALAITGREGIPLEKFAEAIAANASSSATGSMKLASVLAGDFQPRFSMKNMLKDIQFVLRLADENQVELPVASAIAASLMAGIHRGWGEDDFCSLARHYQLPGRYEVKGEEFNTGAPVSEETAPSEPALAKRGILQSLFRKKQP